MLAMISTLHSFTWTGVKRVKRHNHAKHQSLYHANEFFTN